MRPGTSAAVGYLFPMSSRAPFDKPSETFVIDGEVVVIGPAGVGLSFTPEAARETGARLTDAADQAGRRHETPRRRARNGSRQG